MFSQENQLIRKSSIVVAALATIVYMTYRGVYTLNLSGPYACTVSISLYVAEMYGCFLMFLYFFQIWELVEPAPVPPLKDRTVDVFIPTYNEDPELLRGTISAAVNLDYPHRTYVLDDGDRPAVAALAKELGAEYINRPTNLHAKAGNLNHAMEITNGEFVVIFDADHVSRRDFITRLLGYFEDERMGFVQTPHSFYNFDNFHGMLDYKRGCYWEEGELFYNVIQPGKNYWNAVSFCGSAAMFRRQALEDVGLVATETITEDMHTGLRMHARGWNSLFVNERLVSGQAATDVTTFNTQRLRWGEGNLGVFAFDNPLTMKGLTFGQRIGYLGSMLSWTTGVQKLQLYIAPMLMLFTGVAPVAEFSITLTTITILYMLTIWTAVTVTSNGHGHLIGTEITHMAGFWTQIKSTYRALFKRKKSTFVVTSKRGRQSDSIRQYIMPQCLYIGGSALAIAWAGTRYAIGLSSDLNGLLVGSGLLLTQCWFAWEVIRRALRNKEDVIHAWRHPVAINVHFSFVDEKGVLQTGRGVSCDLNEIGMGFHSFDDIGSTDEIEITLSTIGLTATCRAFVRHKKMTLNSKSRRDGNANSWRIGAQFIDPSEESLGTIWRICSDYATARMYDKFEANKRKGKDDSIATLLNSSRLAEHKICLPINVSLPGYQVAPFFTVTEGLSQSGCVILLESRIENDSNVDISIATPLGEIVGEARVLSSKQVILGATALEYVQLKFDRFHGESRSLLLSLCGGADDELLTNVVTLRPREKSLPKFRPAMLAGTTSAAAAVVAVCTVLGFYKDEWLLAQVSGRTEVSSDVSKRLDGLLENVISDPNADENRIVKLREVFQKLGDTERARKLNEVLLERDVESFSASLCRAQSLDSVNRFDEAGRIYNLLLERERLPEDKESQQELLMSAARNAVNRGNTAKAVQLFAEIDEQFLSSTPDLLREYAGLLASTGKPSEAITLILGQATIVDADFFLMGAIYSSKKQFSQAIEQYNHILARQPDNRQAQLLLADNAIWNGDFSMAVMVLKSILQKADSHEAREKLAFASLWNKDSLEALVMFEKLTLEQPARKDYAQAFVEACLIADSITEKQKGLLRSRVAAFPDEVQANIDLFASALSKHQLFDQLRPLLEQILELEPTRVDVRLQLVDVLNSRGKHVEAEAHLQTLLALTSGNENLPSGRLVSTPPVSEPTW